jgi:cold-inducible RNA-binding protein
MRIFVGSLALTTTIDEQRQVFTHYGHVARVQIVTDRETGRSRGFGFVEMPNSSEAQAAIAGLNGREVGGRFLTVSEARPQEGRGSSR